MVPPFLCYPVNRHCLKKALIENPLGAADAQIAKSSRRESIGLSEIQNVLEILFNPRFLLMST